MGLSPMHLILIIGIVLLIFGPSRLPGLGKGMGDAIRGFKKGLKGDEIDVTPNNPNEQINASREDDLTHQTKTTTKNKQDS